MTDSSTEVHTTEQAKPDQPTLLLKGEVGGMLDVLIKQQTGVAVFSKKELDDVKTTLGAKGYVPWGSGLPGHANQQTKNEPKIGDLHRHDLYNQGFLICHHTREGSGIAHFYWTKEGLRELDPKSNTVKGRVSVPFDGDTVLVFPAKVWHQFDTNANQHRYSEFDMLGTKDMKNS